MTEGPFCDWSFLQVSIKQNGALLGAGLSSSCFCLVSFFFFSFFCPMCLIVMSDSLWPYGLYTTKLLCPWDSPGKNTGVDCNFLLQGIFPTQDGIRICCVSCIASRFFTHWAITVNPSSFSLSYSMLSLVFKRVSFSIQVTQISWMIELKPMSRYQKTDFHVLFHKSYLDLVLNRGWKFQSPSQAAC